MLFPQIRQDLYFLKFKNIVGFQILYRKGHDNFSIGLHISRVIEEKTPKMFDQSFAHISSHWTDFAHLRKWPHIFDYLLVEKEVLFI